MRTVTTKQTMSSLLAGILLAGCGGSVESTLSEYAEARWNAMIQGNLDAAYEYYTDAFKESTPLEVFRNQVRGTGLWSRAEVKEVRCGEPGKRCQVDIEVTVAMKMRGLSKPVETSDVIEEVWVKEGWFSDWRYIKQ